MTAHLPDFSQRLIPWQMFIDMGKTTAFVPTRCEWTKKSPKVNKWNDHFNILIAAVFLLVYVLCDLCMVSECVRAFNEIATRNDNNNSKQKCNQNKNINNNNTESNNHSSGKSPHEILLQLRYTFQFRALEYCASRWHGYEPTRLDGRFAWPTTTMW